jgi:uncharacterized protein
VERAATSIRPSSLPRRLRGGLLLALLVTALAAAIDFPPLTGRVVDEANLLSPATRAQLTERLAQHERETSNQLVVVTLKSLRGLPVEDYGYQLGRAWGIGREQRNNGVLLIVAPEEREVRIEVGYGLEGALTDVQSHTIIQSAILPRFREGKFEAGIVEGVDALLGTLAGTYEPLPPAPQEVGKLESAIALGLFALVVGQALTYRLRPRALGSTLVGGGTAVLVWFLIGTTVLAIGVGAVVALLHLLSGGGRGGNFRSHGGGRYGGFGGGGFGGGGFGGSGGGFSGGGGSFGGGGASGSW